MFANLQWLIIFVLTLALFVLEVVALVDCARRPAYVFTREGKRTKTFWLVLLGVAALVGFLGLEPPLGIGYLGLTALLVAIPAFIYFADVRPAIRTYGFGKKNDKRGGW